MSMNGKDDGDFAVKEGPLDEHPEDIPPATLPYRQGPQPEPGTQEVQAELPDGLGVAATIQWVANDKARAKVALDAEHEGGGARSTLVEQLERILNEDTGAGIVSNEA